MTQPKRSFPSAKRDYSHKLHSVWDGFTSELNVTEPGRSRVCERTEIFGRLTLWIDAAPRQMESGLPPELIMHPVRERLSASRFRDNPQWKQFADELESVLKGYEASRHLRSARVEMRTSGSEILVFTQQELTAAARRLKMPDGHTLSPDYQTRFLNRFDTREYLHNRDAEAARGYVESRLLQRAAEHRLTAADAETPSAIQRHNAKILGQLGKSLDLIYATVKSRGTAERAK